ncbi:MAG TPA: ABC transporter permease [Firmicutes bacterium]|nr:ABC transporter permease [Bacillota bacterium]
MLAYLRRRLIGLIPLLIGVTLLSFLIANLSPGDPIAMYLDPNKPIDPARVEAIKRDLGLDKPLLTRYFLWLRKLVKGDLGYSISSKRLVKDEIKARLGPTMLLAVTSLAISFVIGIALGIYSALNQYKVGDYILTVMSFIGISMPSFWFAMMLIIVFTGKLGWLPSVGMTDFRTPPGTWNHIVDVARHLVMPVLVSVLGSIAGWARMERSMMLEVLRQDYIRTAKSKGLESRTIILRHAVRNAAIPIVTSLGMSLPGLIGGSFVIESIFGWPGMGRLGTQAIFSRDYPVIMGVNIASSFLIMFGNLLADITYALVDPRIRIQGGVGK